MADNKGNSDENIDDESDGEGEVSKGDDGGEDPDKPNGPKPSGPPRKNTRTDGIYRLGPIKRVKGWEFAQPPLSLATKTDLAAWSQWRSSLIDRVRETIAARAGHLSLPWRPEEIREREELYRALLALEHSYIRSFKDDPLIQFQRARAGIDQGMVLLHLAIAYHASPATCDEKVALALDSIVAARKLLRGLTHPGVIEKLLRLFPWHHTHLPDSILVRTAILEAAAVEAILRNLLPGSKTKVSVKNTAIRSIERSVVELIENPPRDDASLDEHNYSGPLMHVFGLRHTLERTGIPRGRATAYLKTLEAALLYGMALAVLKTSGKAYAYSYGYQSSAMLTDALRDRHGPGRDDDPLLMDLDLPEWDAIERAQEYTKAALAALHARLE